MQRRSSNQRRRQVGDQLSDEAWKTILNEVRFTKKMNTLLKVGSAGLGCLLLIAWAAILILILYHAIAHGKEVDFDIIPWVPTTGFTLPAPFIFTFMFSRRGLLYAGYEAAVIHKDLGRMCQIEEQLGIF